VALDGWNRDRAGNLQRTYPVPGMEIVGARFRNARIRAGLSQRRVADLAGVSQSSVSRLERGVSGGMRTEVLLRIAISIPGLPLGFCPHGHRCAYPFDPRGMSFIDLDGPRPD
jgi:DNA-binding XRE family transcriptional regulator